MRLTGSLVSLIRFAIYHSGVLKDVEKEVEGCMATLFTDNCRWLVEEDSVEQLFKWLERARIKAVKWGERNHVAFDNMKNDMIAFT